MNDDEKKLVEEYRKLFDIKPRNASGILACLEKKFDLRQIPLEALNKVFLEPFYF